MAPSILNGDFFPKGIFGLLGDTHILVYYNLLPPQKIEVYRVKIMYTSKIQLTQFLQWYIQIKLSQ